MTFKVSKEENKALYAAVDQGWEDKDLSRQAETITEEEMKEWEATVSDPAYRVIQRLEKIAE